MTPSSAFYRERYRPQFHYSPPCRWMNDPNGLVYYEGEYHLFYQFTPTGMTPGAMHWGHAVSSDLVYWQTLPIGLYPDDIGPIWSGCGVVDAHNTSGLVPGGGLVILYSYQNQSQAVAYSTDNGRTWIKYAGNPVIEARATDFRDPKVFWHEASGQWIMVLAAGQEVQFFRSPNLLDWQYCSSFSGGHLAGGVWEVPDLFPLALDGQTRWAMLVSVNDKAPAGGSGIQYFIGDFDGQTFTNNYPDSILWLDYGPDNYAGTTWDNAPDNRRIYIGWLDNWKYAAILPTSPWRGAATLPRELRLVQTSDGIRLAQAPVGALSQLRRPIGKWENVEVTGERVFSEVQGRTLEIIAEIDGGTAQRFGVNVHRGAHGRTRVSYDGAQAQLLINRADSTEDGVIDKFNPTFGAPLLLENGRLRLHLFVDETSVEVFAQDGLQTLTSQTFAHLADDGFALFAEGGNVRVSQLEIYHLDSIWSQDGNKEQQASDFDFCG